MCGVINFIIAAQYLHVIVIADFTFFQIERREIKTNCSFEQKLILCDEINMRRDI